MSGKRGVFWLVDGEIVAIPYTDDATVGIAKSGNNYNHRLLWEHVRLDGCKKAFNYYPRGRVEMKRRGTPIVYMSPHIGMDYLSDIMKRFELEEIPLVHYDGSDHYKCWMDYDSD